jgi:hypothetical protein
MDRMPSGVEEESIATARGKEVGVLQGEGEHGLRTGQSCHSRLTSVGIGTKNVPTPVPVYSECNLIFSKTKQLCRTAVMPFPYHCRGSTISCRKDELA